MLKKVFIAAVAVLLGLLVVKKTELGSFMRVAWKDAATCVRKQVPPETEIERLRDEITRLGKDSKQHFSAIAEEMVAVENLEKDIQVARANMEKQERSLARMRDDLKKDVEFINYGDSRYSRKQVENQLKRDWTSYQRLESDLKAREQMLEARRSALGAAREQLAAMQDTKQQLEVELANLETELKTVRVAQTRSKFHLDDSDLSRIKAGVDNLRNRIKVEQKSLEVQGEFANGPIRVDEKSSKDVLKEIDAHFGKTDGKKVAIDRN